MRVYSPQYLTYLTSSANANNTFPKRTITSKEWALMAHIYAVYINLQLNKYKSGLTYKEKAWFIGVDQHLESISS